MLALQADGGARVNVHAVGLPCGQMNDGDEELTDPEESGDVTCGPCRDRMGTWVKAER